MDAQIIPTDILDSGDPGDDILQRFRYQITYAAILALHIIEEGEKISEIYCEHHEDVLVKHDDETFTGVQVKTRNIDLLPFTIEDEVIRNCLKRFVRLNKDFPGKFRGFSIVSNHGFDKTKVAVCLKTLIQNVKDGKDVLAPRSKSKALINFLAKECDCTIECVIDTIKKTRTKSFCALEDIHMKLINAIKTCGLVKGLTESKINDIADKIVGKAFKASSLFQDDIQLSIKFVLGIASAEDETAAIIDSKCIKRPDLVSWFEAECVQPATILLKDRDPIPQDAKEPRRLQIKMDAGGIDSENIDLLQDFKFAFEQHAASWIYKNSEEAEANYNQVLKVTHNLCKEIYDEQSIKDSNDGSQMLIHVRRRIGERKNTEPQIFFDCSYEHVLGAVGVLTEQCKVWWSSKFLIQE